MPLGIERINVRTAQPNPNINFIKPLEGFHKAHAQDLLERVAAICVPIMKANHIYVMSLEEFPPNNEFLGRNFNAGEVIQLVLKNKNGGWLPFKFVQRVLMHELAHCKQMNHSKAFYQVNNQYCAELKVLWDKGYSGEGMWSRGVLLANGNFVHERPLIEGDVPQHLCGGTFRSNRKRKRGVAEKEKISYQERQQRRIAKKFGTNGVALGADDEIKAKLEKGKRPAGKPRVAGSARGRELRAAAALARFEKPQTLTANEFGDAEGSETESDEEDAKIQPDDAKDINGNRLVDPNGRGMIKVCEDDDDSVEARKEMEELRNLEYVYGKPSMSNAVALTASPRVGGLASGQQTHNYESPYSSGDTFGFRTYSKSLRDAEKEHKYESPYSSSRDTLSYRNYAKSLRDAEKEHKTNPQPSHGSSYRREPVNHASLHPDKTNTVKREVFDILSDYLGDPTCNPEGAIYSGLEAARAGRPARKSQDSRKSVDPSSNATPGFGVNGIPHNGTESSHIDSLRRPQFEQSRPHSASVPSATSIALPLIVPHPRYGRQMLGTPARQHPYNNHQLPASYGGDIWPLVPLVNDNSGTGGEPLSNSIGATNKKVKTHGSGFARAVEKRHREETIGLPHPPPSPEPIPKIPSSLANTHVVYKPKSTYTNTSQLPNPPKAPVTSSQPVHSRPPLENVTSIPSTQSTHSVPQHQQASTSQARPNISKPSTQAPRPAPQPAPVSRAPAPIPRASAVAPTPVREPPPTSPPGVCEVCTTMNDADSLTCMICSNVLHPDRDPFHWRCKSAICKGTQYVNSGDYGICGVCGEKKPLRT